MKILLPFLFILLLSCDQNHLDSRISKTPKQGSDSIKATSKTLIPIAGHRFSIRGDFDGDGIDETLTEHYVSQITNQETNKGYENHLDYDSLVVLTVKKRPQTFVSASTKKINTLQISKAHQLLGLSFLKNEGDLNGDGTDEVSYVIDYADWSSLNNCYIITYKHQKWQDLQSFPIWDWQLTDDTFNPKKGLIKKITNTKVQVTGRNKDDLGGVQILILKKLR
jgi:hypothetical protein